MYSTRIMTALGGAVPINTINTVLPRLDQVTRISMPLLPAMSADPLTSRCAPLLNSHSPVLMEHRDCIMQSLRPTFMNRKLQSLRWPAIFRPCLLYLKSSLTDPNTTKDTVPRQWVMISCPLEVPVRHQVLGAIWEWQGTIRLRQYIRPRILFPRTLRLFDQV